MSTEPNYKHQMRVNLSYALAYEKALEEIAALLGYVAPTGSPTGAPPEDIDQIALRLVKERLK